jgi:hypothetical protein
LFIIKKVLKKRNKIKNQVILNVHQSSKSGSDSSFVDVAQLCPQHMTDVFVRQNFCRSSKKMIDDHNEAKSHKMGNGDTYVI